MVRPVHWALAPFYRIRGIPIVVYLPLEGVIGLGNLPQDRTGNGVRLAGALYRAIFRRVRSGFASIR